MYKLRLLLILIFSLWILRGGAQSAEPPIAREAIEKETVGMPVIKILEIAGEYTYSNMNVALIYGEMAIKTARQNNSLSDEFDSYRSIGFIYEDNAQYDNALSAYSNALKVAEKIGNSGLLSSIYNDMAILCRKKGNYRDSYFYYDKTKEIAERTNDQEMLAATYHGLGHLYREVGIYPSALDNYIKSLTISESANKIQDIIVSHIDIAETYLKAKEIDKATIHTNKAYNYVLEQLKLKSNDETEAQLASVLKSIGNILLAQRRYEEALEKNIEALKIYQKLGFKSRIAMASLQVAIVLLEQKKFTQAEDKFKECLVLEKHYLNPDLAELYYQMGILYRDLNNTLKSEAMFMKSLAIANKFDLTKHAQQANYQLFLVKFEQNDKVEALKYLNLANALSDSLFNEAKQKQTAEIELKYDIAQNEKKIQTLLLNENALKLQQNRILLVGSIVFFLTLLLLLGYIIQQHRQGFSALKQKNEEIQQQYRRLEENNEILSQFAYVAAHDLKEPLRSIGSYVGLIQMKYGRELPNDAKEYMQFVHAGVKRMYSLLTDLLDFSQVLAQQPGAEVTRPEEVLEDVKANLRNAIELRNAIIEYDVNLPSVRMNRLHMLQLFQNLIGNALKFSTRQPIVRVEGKEENGQILLTVEDNGIGIKQEFGSKVFVLFQQLNKKDKFEGTGIGLTICKNIVEKYNGKIWFDSEENVGTKFYISFPSQVA